MSYTSIKWDKLLDSYVVSCSCGFVRCIAIHKFSDAQGIKERHERQDHR